MLAEGEHTRDTLGKKYAASSNAGYPVVVSVLRGGGLGRAG